MIDDEYKMLDLIDYFSPYYYDLVIYENKAIKDLLITMLCDKINEVEDSDKVKRFRDDDCIEIFRRRILFASKERVLDYNTLRGYRFKNCIYVVNSYGEDEKYYYNKMKEFVFPLMRAVSWEDDYKVYNFQKGRFVHDINR